MSNTAIHNNSNIVAVIDTETTGLHPIKDELMQVCVLLLDPKYDPLKNVVPFYCDLKLNNPDKYAIKHSSMTKLDFLEVSLRGIDKGKAIDLFDDWYNRLPIPNNKKLIPLAHNWIHDYQFLANWLGHEAMGRYFTGHYRDTQVAALYENDRADHQVEQIPYPKLSLRYISTQLKVENPRMHDALFDCITTAKSYKRMLGHHIPPLLVNEYGEPIMSQVDTPGFPKITVEAPEP